MKGGRTAGEAAFVWGAATSAHQVEGNNIHNDWWAWEQKLPKNRRSGVACDHFRRFREDFALAKRLGHTAHRLSLEWSRIEPAPGQWSEPALAHYRQVLEELRRLGLTSFVTLHHFTNPQWLVARGGWRSREAPELFARYVRTVAERLGDLIDFWIPINEANVYATQSFWQRRWPPQQHSALAVYQVMRHLAQAHRRAFRVIHRVRPEAHVGHAHSVVAYQPAHQDHILDRWVAGWYDWAYNHWFLRRTAGRFDFLGINYYFSARKHVTVLPLAARDEPWLGERSDLGWPIDPRALTDVLVALKGYDVPLYITENGLADTADSKRADFIRAHLRAIEAAQRQGADVRGYLHWSLLDNFEWAEGFAPRFGLVAVDYATLERTPRPSAYAFKAIIEEAQKAY